MLNGAVNWSRISSGVRMTFFSEMSGSLNFVMIYAFRSANSLNAFVVR